MTFTSRWKQTQAMSIWRLLIGRPMDGRDGILVNWLMSISGIFCLSSALRNCQCLIESRGEFTKKKASHEGICENNKTWEFLNFDRFQHTLFNILILNEHSLSYIWCIGFSNQPSLGRHLVAYQTVTKGCIRKWVPVYRGTGLNVQFLMQLTQVHWIYVFLKDICMISKDMVQCCHLVLFDSAVNHCLLGPIV